MELWELFARESIRDIVARYNSNGDSGRIDTMVQLFATDAVLDIKERGKYQGIEAIRNFLSAVPNEDDTATATRIRHLTATHQIDLLDKKNAKGRCYFLVLTDQGIDHWGVYSDTYIAIDGAWKFQSRSVKVEGDVPDSWARKRLSSK